MSITRRVNYRLYPHRQQEDTLHYWRRMHCNLYNAAVYNRKTQYQKFGHSVNYLEQQNCLPAFKQVWTEYKALGSHALQATLKRVDFAYALLNIYIKQQQQRMCFFAECKDKSLQKLFYIAI